MATIRNKKQLVENGKTQLDRRARSLALQSFEHCLKTIDPKNLMKSKVILSDSSLRVDQYSFDLRKYKNIYVVGGGKASGSMAEHLEGIVGRFVTRGLVNVPRNCKWRTDIIKLHEASHPMPDEAGVEGTRQMLEMAEEAKDDDLVICLISGGGSSLMPLPLEGISIKDKSVITDLLLKSGSTINEINTVRKHISNFKGGWLAKKAYPATVLNLVLSDVVGDPLDSIASGPTVPDSTTFREAINVLKKHNLWGKTPTSIKQVLLDGESGLILETPKGGDNAFKKVYNVVIGNNRAAGKAACEDLKAAGLNTLLLTSTLEGEAQDVGTVMASIAIEASSFGNPVPKPSGIVAGGETTVTVGGRGMGGRNQETALAAAMKISGLDGTVVASMSTDGVDGPTDAAGAIVDGKTFARTLDLKMNIERFLSDNDSYTILSELEDTIHTGPTGTNVNDIIVIIAL